MAGWLSAFQQPHIIIIAAAASSDKSVGDFETFLPQCPFNDESTPRDLVKGRGLGTWKAFSWCGKMLHLDSTVEGLVALWVLI